MTEQQPTQLTELLKAIEICGSVSELARRLEMCRQQLSALKTKAKTIGSGKDLCAPKLAMRIDITCKDPDFDWRLLCPDTNNIIEKLKLDYLINPRI